MATLKYMSSSRNKKCRICDDVIALNTWCLVMENIRVPNMSKIVIVDLFFHEGCLSRALDYAKETRSLIVEN